MPGSSRGAAIRRPPMAPSRSQLWCGSGLVGKVVGPSRVFYFHIAKFFRVEDLATLQALDKLHVVVPGDDSDFRVSAGSCHRSLEQNQSWWGLGGFCARSSLPGGRDDLRTVLSGYSNSGFAVACIDRAIPGLRCPFCFKEARHGLLVPSAQRGAAGFRVSVTQGCCLLLFPPDCSRL
jgi:hypothetical protein